MSQPEQRASRHNWSAIAAVFLLLTTLGFTAHAKPAGGSEPPVRALLVPVMETTLSSRMAGRIVKMDGKEGERFTKGQKLIAFDCEVQRSHLKKARAKLLAAQKTHASNLQLREYDSVGELELELSATEVKSTQADVEVIRAKLKRCDILAPFNGRIVELLAHPYESVSVHQPLMAILDDSQLEVRLYIPSWWLSWIQNDTTFKIEVDETGKSYPARITRLGARVDPASQSLEITAVIVGEHTELLSGMSGTAVFNIPGKQ